MAEGMRGTKVHLGGVRNSLPRIEKNDTLPVLQVHMHLLEENESFLIGGITMPSSQTLKGPQIAKLL